MKKIFLALLLLNNLAFADNLIVTKTKVISSTPTISTSAYTAGDAIGGKGTLANAVSPAVSHYGQGYSGIIASSVILDKDKEGADIDVVYFNADPTSTTVTDNAALTIADADLAKIICTVSITTDIAFADNGISQALNQNCGFNVTNPATSIYYILVARGTPTYTSTSDLTLVTTIYQD